MRSHTRILIVEDEPNVQLVFRTALESEGHLVSIANDGTQVLEQLSQAPADLILLDLQLPGKDGMQVLEELKAHAISPPVVIVTAHGSIPDAVRALKLGAVDFLTKPLTPAALRKTVSDVLERHAAPLPLDVPRSDPVVTATTEFERLLRNTKRAINQRAFAEAEIYIKEAIAVNPSSAEAYNLLGVLCELRGAFPECLSAYRSALKHDRHYQPTHHNLTRYYELYTFGRSETPVDLGSV